MRRALIAISLLVALGCQSQKPVAHQTVEPETRIEAQAAALVFDPPVASASFLPDLSREGRERSAFVGYEELTTTFTYLRVDDRATTDHNDRYERRAITQRTSMTTR